MLTSFFGNSRPVNFILVGVYIFIFYLSYNFMPLFSEGWGTTFTEAGIFVVVLLSIFILNFISGRNELTGRNSYKSIIFAGFLCMFPAALQHNDVVMANLFLLLALRRVLSLKSQRHTISKIFDATLWVGMASLFYFWSILFLFVIYFGIMIHVSHRFKNWLVPLVGFITLFSLVTCVDLYFTGSFYTFTDWFQESNFNFENYRELELLLPAAFLLALSLWASFFYVGIIQKASANAKASLFMVLLWAGVALTGAVLAPNKNGSELMFFYAPLAIIVTNYFQHLEDKWFKEGLFVIIVLVPVLLLVLL